MGYEEIRSYVELGSLALTIPLLVLCFVVVYECFPFVVRCFKSYKDDKKICWILCGIFFGFGGHIVDNFYWAIPWTSHFLSLPYTEALIKFGVFPNIFFRQFLTALSAYCHIRAFIAPENYRDAKWLNVLFLFALTIGFLYAGYLLILKHTPL